MKAITISQPYASMILTEKWIENRYWPTRYRGPLLIHAGKGTQFLTKKELVDYPTGCLIGVCNLVACLASEDITAAGKLYRWQSMAPGACKTWTELYEHPHMEGPFCFVLHRVRKITPIDMPGAMGLWECAINRSELHVLGAAEHGV